MKAGFTEKPLSENVNELKQTFQCCTSFNDTFNKSLSNPVWDLESERQRDPAQFSELFLT